MDGLVLGASSGIARALVAERWKSSAAPGERWVLGTRAGVALPDLLQAAGPRHVDWRSAQASDDPWLLLNEIGQGGWRPRRVLLAWGRLLPGGRGSEAELREMREVNGAASLRWLAALADWLPEGAHLAVLGSVAGDRPRPSMWDYSLSKQELERGVQALRRAYPKLHWTLVKPGPVATPMTAHMKQDSPLLASPAAIAPRLLKAWEEGWPQVYAPIWWDWISRVLGWVPEPLWKHVPF